MRGTRYDDRRNSPQPPNRLLRFVELSDMRIASQKPIRGRPASMLLQRSEQHRSGLLKPPGEKMTDADRHVRSCKAVTRAEPQCGFKMLNREIRFPGP